MMRKAFVVSDIHGMYDHFKLLLSHWDEEEQYLVVLGDLIDRGPQSLEVVRLVMQLKETYGERVIVLQGNHDQMLHDYIEGDYEQRYVYINSNGGAATLGDFSELGTQLYYHSQQEVADIIKEKCTKELAFLQQGHLYYEFGKVLFTHAGFCSWAHSWEETSNEQFIWIRNHYKHKNTSGFVNVFGHTPTQLINTNKSNDVWLSEDKSYIAIDGACAYGGQLNGIVINDDGELLQTYSVR